MIEPHPPGPGLPEQAPSVKITMNLKVSLDFATDTILAFFVSPRQQIFCSVSKMLILRRHLRGIVALISPAQQLLWNFNAASLFLDAAIETGN